MLLRTKALIAGVALNLATVACDASDCDALTPAPASIEPIGAELFRVDQGGGPGSAALFRSGESVQLIDSAGEQPVEVRATLSAAALEALAQAESSLRDGGAIGSFDSMCLTFLDRDQVQLWLDVSQASLSFRYPWGCPPSGLAEVDATLIELRSSMPSCSPTPLLTACEIIGD